MKMIPRTLTISFLLSFARSNFQVPESLLHHRVRKCFLRAQFHHPASGQCLEPLERGPCAENQWLVPATQNKLILECQKMPEERENLTLLESGDVGAQEQATMFLRGDCLATERQLPVNFAMNTRPCPRDHRCSSAVGAAVTILAAFNATSEYQSVEDYFKNMVCSTKPYKRALCLPVDRKSPLTEENLYKSLQSPDLICIKNPCPEAEEPYQDKDGYFRCHNLLRLRPRQTTSLASHHCRRGRLFRGGRCVPKFFG